MLVMRFVNAVSPILVAAILACSDVPHQTVTNPDFAGKLKFTAASACDAGLDATVNAEIDRLFSIFHREEAHTRWRVVESSCVGDVANAREAMLRYIQLSIEVFRSNGILKPSAGTAADSVVANWNSAFAYVGYDQPNLNSNVLGQDGAAGVIPATIPGNQQELKAPDAALTMFSQNSMGDPRGHLFTIVPLAAGCLGGTNLTQTGPCFEFSSFPHVSPSFNPAVKVGICEPLKSNQPLPGRRPALGHLAGGFVLIPGQTAYPTFCAHTDDPPPVLGWSNGVSGIVRRVAWMAKRALTPEPLFAVHGGLGGTGSGLSPFGAVDLTVFEASLDHESLGGAPALPNAGVWTSFITKPGKISSQLGLGTYPDTILVLNQAGGNCAKCGGIMLQGNLTDASSAGATAGIYQASWISLQDKPIVKDAPFVLRGTTGEIARLSYRSINSRKELYYNNALVGNWVQHEAQRFVITIDLNTKMTSLWFGPPGANPEPPPATIPFLNSAANLGQIAADFRSQDSGIMGWAAINLARMEDLRQ